MTPAQRREARIALAMLPVGAGVFVGSVVAFVAVAALASATPFGARASVLWIEAWCLFAAAIAVWNARAGIEMMAAFDWRPLPFALLRSGAAVAGFAALP